MEIFLQLHGIADSAHVRYRWTFRSQDLAPRFTVMPTVKSKGSTVIPPIYSIVSYLILETIVIALNDMLNSLHFLLRKLMRL